MSESSVSFPCPSCKSPFNLSEYKPMSLSCGHSLCSTCLDALKSAEAKQADQSSNNSNDHAVCCQVCKHYTSHQDVSEHYVMCKFLQNQQVISQVNQSTSSVDTMNVRACDMCKADHITEPPTSHCFECKQWLCDYHLKLHAAKQPLHNDVQTCQVLDCNPELLKRTEHTPNLPSEPCASHASESVTQYCMECDQFMCQLCAQDAHCDHRLQDSKTLWPTSVSVATSAVQSLNKCISSQRTSMIELNSAIQEICTRQCNTSGLLDRVDALAREILEHSSKMRSAITSRSEFITKRISLDFDSTADGQKQVESALTEVMQLFDSRKIVNSVDKLAILLYFVEAKPLLASLLFRRSGFCSDIWDAIGSNHIQLTTLTHFACVNSSFTTRALECLVEALPSLPNLLCLDLSSSKLNATSCTLLSRGFAYLPKLTDLWLMNNAMGGSDGCDSSGVQAMCREAGRLRSLRCFDAKNNKLSKESGLLLIESLGKLKGVNSGRLMLNLMLCSDVDETYDAWDDISVSFPTVALCIDA